MSQSFTARDDRFHFEEMGDAWWATETAWFSFHDPQRRLGGWLYTMVRPNIGTVAGGAWIWDDAAHLPWEALYCANYSALQLPRDQDLDDCSFRTAFRSACSSRVCVMSSATATPNALLAQLKFDAVMRPQPLTAVGSTFGNAHHFDQLGRVTGELVLHGERISIDCIGMRDRTWGMRPEDRPRQAAYVTAASVDGNGFLAVTNVRDQRDAVAYGFLRRNGETTRPRRRRAARRTRSGQRLDHTHRDRGA